LKLRVPTDNAPQGLPKEWDKVLEDSGITKREREQNPQVIADVMNFYTATTDPVRKNLSRTRVRQWP
jgi:hypothetical protein